jgi:hypothetical protein
MDGTFSDTRIVCQISRRGYRSISQPLLSIEIVSRKIEFIFTCIVRVCYLRDAGTARFLVLQSLKVHVVILVLSWCVDAPLFVD